MPSVTSAPTDAAAQAVALLAAELKAITEAKAAADARQKALTDALSQLGGLITPPAPPKPSIGQRAAGLWSALPHVNLLWVVVIALGLIVAHDHAAFAWPSWLHWPSVVKPVVPTPTGPLRVILVHDATSNESQAQLGVIYSTAVRAWLTQHCEKDSAGGAGWRIWDKSVKPDGEADKFWPTAWASVQPKITSLPAIVIFHGLTGAGYPLPDTEAAALDLLSKNAGGS